MAAGSDHDRTYGAREDGSVSNPQCLNQPPLRPWMKRSSRFPRIVLKPRPRRRPSYATPMVPAGRTPALRALVAVVVAIALGLLIYLITLSSRPSIAAISPAPGSTSPPGPVTISASLTSNAGPIQRLVFILDGHEVVPAVRVDSSRTWTMEYRRSLAKGSHTATVKVFDSDGRQTEHHWTFTASGRVITPSFTFIEPPPGSVLPPGQLRLSARFTTSSSPKSFSVLLDGQPIPSTLTQAKSAVEDAQLWLITASPDLVPGGHQVEIRTTDDRGRVTSATLDLSATRDDSRLTARYFPDQGLYVTGSFLKFWMEAGHYKIFGEPVSPQFVAPNGVTTQYFETARLELGKNGTINLGLLGKQVLKTPQPRAPKPSDPSVRYFPATGHTLSGKFLLFWKTYGGLDIFGYPISEPITESGHPVQYFERAKLELRVSSSSNALQVHMVPLGTQLWQQFGTGR